jgi:hypothetical protein
MDRSMHSMDAMMQRRSFVSMSLVACALSGCRSYQFAHVLKKTDENMVGSHSAGAEVFDPLVDEAVAKLLGRQSDTAVNQLVSYEGEPPCKTICFVGIENKSAEELGDFKDQLYQQIDTQIVQSNIFRPISRRVVDSALVETRLRPDSLLVPDNMRLFTASLERQGAPMDYLLFATLTSGTTEKNKSTQRDYLLTLELTNVHTGAYDKQSAEVRKGYHKSPIGKFWNYNPLTS